MKILYHTILALIFLTPGFMRAHCQMPCGIYHDEMVFAEIEEHVETLAKAVHVLQENERKSIQDYNQITRWVRNKEKTADQAREVLVNYFLQQRLKPESKSDQQLVLCIHKLLVLSMKIKQHVDQDYVDQFSNSLARFKNEYFSSRS